MTSAAAPERGPAPLVAICVITCQRPQSLERLLASLSGLSLEDDEARVLVRVVDNDPAKSAARVVAEAQASARFPLVYEAEPNRGIPFARNTAFRVPDETQFIACIDDDEVADPDWLRALLRVQQQTNADLVAGPVVPHFATSLPSWVVRGRFYDRPRHPTGTELNGARTGNLLIRRAALEGIEGPFSPRFAATGGSDAHLAKVLRTRGRRLVWADGAIVHEEVYPSRLKISWLLRRAYRTGVTMAMIRSELPGPLAGSLINLTAAARWLTQGLLMMPLSLFGLHWMVKALRWLCYGGGLCTGMVGFRYHEYREIQGQ